MKRLAAKKQDLLRAVGVIGAGLFIVLLSSAPHTSKTHAAEISEDQQVAALQTEVNRLKSIATDQSHAMADVGYHFANLWFAGEKKNWPMAKFYFDETRSHLNWAVRVIPIRKDPAGNDIDLKAILQALDATLMKKIGESIEAKNSQQFAARYKDMIEGCYSCHKASGKPYLRPQIPVTPPQSILNYDPDAKWPE